MGTCVHFSRSLPSNSWWQTMVGWHVLSRPSAAEGGGRRPAFTGLATSHTRPPRSTAGNINSAGCLKTGPQYKSNLTAIDPVTGEIKKTVHLQYPNYSGTVSTGGGLVFLGLTDGTVAAFDDITLEQLWKINVGS